MENEKPTTVKETLFEYVKDPKTWFYWYHNPERVYSLCNKEERWDEKWKKENFHRLRGDFVIGEHKNPKNTDIVIHKNLNAFFEATLDEVRLKKANAFSKYALWISGNRPLAYFRKAASKREVAADIDFNMQRDHAVHTLYNYILGWYLLDKSDTLQEGFWKYLKYKFDLETISGEEEEFYKEHSYFLFIKDSKFIKSIDLIDPIYPNKEFISIILGNEFGDVWSITSLLHDIGYILEGTISTASTEVENVRVIKGSKVIHDYFNHYFWGKCKVDYRSAQNIAKLLEVSVPDFTNSQSLASLGDRLCDIGSCENIREKLIKSEDFKTLNKDKKIKIEQYDLNREAFSIWNMYYEITKNDTMKNILEIVKSEYYDAMGDGYNQGYRNLNHGVCSGLIVLQALTFYHELVWGFALVNWIKFNSKQDKEKDHVNCISEQIYTETQDRIVKRYYPEEMSIRHGLSVDFWFKKVLWSTASIAIHDLIQKEYYERICEKYGKKELGKIALDDDPLAFLGVLVDALEEWDRYTISGESAFSGKTELLQSTEVDIDITMGKINFYYPPLKCDKDFSKDIEKTLNRCLSKWDDLVGIGKKFSCPYCGAPALLEPLKTPVDVHLYKAKCGYELLGDKGNNKCIYYRYSLSAIFITRRSTKLAQKKLP